MQPNAQTLLPCPGCRAPLEAIEAAGHYQTQTQLEHCPECRLVWFDPLELSSLSKAGWVDLLLTMARSAGPRTLAAAPLQGQCPHCASALKVVHNLTKMGRFTGLSCPVGHGEAQRDGALLASRGLFRPLLIAERVALATEKRALDCQQCGAALTGEADACSFCQSPVTVVDFPRLAVALGLHDAQAVARVKVRAEAAAPAPAAAWPCHACGHPLDPTREPHCRQCRHPVLAPSLRDLIPLLQATQARLAQLAGVAGSTALRHVDATAQRRVAGLSQRPAHQQALSKLNRVFTQRVGGVATVAVVAWVLGWLVGL